MLDDADRTANLGNERGSGWVQHDEGGVIDKHSREDLVIGLRMLVTGLVHTMQSANEDQAKDKSSEVSFGTEPLEEETTNGVSW